VSSSIKNTPATRWLSVEAAADVLGMTAAALRKSLERRAVRAPDGGVEAEIDGVRARKLGRNWRVLLSQAWTLPLASQSVRADRESTRS
jgi:hypothetical protein